MPEKVIFPKKSKNHSIELDEFNLIKSKTQLALAVLSPWIFFSIVISPFVSLLLFDFLLFLTGGAGLFLFVKIVIFKRPHELSLYQRLILTYHSKIFYSGIIVSTISWIMLLLLIPDPGLIVAIFGFVFTPILIVYYIFLVRKYPYLFEKKIDY